MSQVFSTVAAVLSIPSNSSSIAIQPVSGTEWVIHNIGVNNNAILWANDTVNNLSVSLFTYSGLTLHTNVFFHVSNQKYLSIQNITASSSTTPNILVWYNGVRTL